MLQSYVLRLVPSALDRGQLVGTLQVVETGETTPFGSLDELLDALLPLQRTTEPRTVDLRAVTALRVPPEQRC